MDQPAFSPPRPPSVDYPDSDGQPVAETDFQRIPLRKYHRESDAMPPSMKRYVVPRLPIQNSQIFCLLSDRTLFNCTQRAFISDLI